MPILVFKNQTLLDASCLYFNITVIITAHTKHTITNTQCHTAMAVTTTTSRQRPPYALLPEAVQPLPAIVPILPLFFFFFFLETLRPPFCYTVLWQHAAT